LLTLGDPNEISKFEKWPNYLELGLGPEQIPDLIRMATDPELNEADSENPGVWAPLHAWRALGQLHADAAVQPLLTLLQRADDHYDDWVSEELPEVFALIGPAALPALAANVADASRGTYFRAAIARALELMAQRHPELRAQCVGMITGELEKAENSNPELNGFLLASLLDLGAEEAAPAMERAFAAGRVDESIAGNWEGVQYELGLREELPQRPLSDAFRMADRMANLPVERPPRDHKAKAKAKAKRKQAAKARKRNRKKE
jgi:hypothetical protein